MNQVLSTHSAIYGHTELYTAQLDGSNMGNCLTLKRIEIALIKFFKRRRTAQASKGHCPLPWAALAKL